MLPKLFRKAGATGHVFFLKGGQPKDKGLAYSGLAGPWTTVAVVPEIDQICQFSVQAQTKDKQSVTIAGDVTVSFDAKRAVGAFDFTVDVRNGSYTGNWNAMLQSAVSEKVLGPAREKAKTLDVGEITSAHAQFEAAIAAALAPDTAAGKLLAEKGIVYKACSVPEATPDDEEVSESIGATERMELLSEADDARHKRRMDAARNERTVKTYEAKTVLGLETERKKLVLQQGENEKTRAEADAQAMELRLAPIKELEPGVGLVAALMKMSDKGVGSLTVTPELFALLKSNAK